MKNLVRRGVAEHKFGILGGRLRLKKPKPEKPATLKDLRRGAARLRNEVRIYDRVVGLDRQMRGENLRLRQIKKETAKAKAAIASAQAEANALVKTRAGVRSIKVTSASALNIQSAMNRHGARRLFELKADVERKRQRVAALDAEWKKTISGLRSSSEEKRRLMGN